MRVGAFKNRPKSKQKVRKNSKLAKMLKKMVPVIPFFEKIAFLVDFWIPEGTPNLPKVGATFWGKWSWKPSGSHFGRFSALFWILASFLVDSGSILGHPGSNLEPFW